MLSPDIQTSNLKLQCSVLYIIPNHLLTRPDLLPCKQVPTPYAFKYDPVVSI